MSTVAVNTKNGHPVAGIVLGIVGIAVALLMTLLFGVIAGGIAAALGIGALLLGISARKGSSRGVGAIVAGALALVMAVSMTFASVGTMTHLREVAAKSGVAPTFTKFMDNPYLGLSSVVANAVNASKDAETMKTIQDELEALIDGLTGESARENCAAIRKWFGYYETGRATDAACEYIIGRLGSKDRMGD